MENKIIINIQLTEDLKKEIEEAAKKVGLSISAYIRLAVSEKLNK
jgi:antitoxin component of RelBE/YafQ-DinJ toxin-antitoxin module